MAQPVQIPLSGTGELSSAEAFWRHDPPYHLFILSSLAFAVVVGFTLAILAPLSIVLEWGWGRRILPLTQAHGQAQTLGFVGLFIIGMVYRLMPRFSGRPLSLPVLAWASWPMLSMAVVLRLIAQPAGEGLWQRTLLVSSGCLGMLAASAFALVVMGTLLHRNSRAGATGYLQKIKERLIHGGVPTVTEHLMHGNAASEVLDLSHNIRAGLEALTSHGRSGGGRWVRGSVAGRWVPHAGQPVVVVRGHS